MNHLKKASLFGLLAALAVGTAGCSDRKKQERAGSGDNAGEGGKVGGGVIKIDGSSTVYPINQAVAEEFQAKHGGQITIGVSGTGGGFKKFCRGETAITGASRPIKETEREDCKRAGIDFIELPVAYDGLAVAVNPKNDWVDYMTVEELKRVWEPEATGKITRWSQVREGWPDQPIRLFAPGIDSGTYDYFTEAIVGKEDASRSDMTSSEDDNVLVQGVATDKNALGFFGYAYYAENQTKLKAVPIDDGKADNGDGPVAPSMEAVMSGQYQPLSRPLFIYVSTKDAQRPEVARLIQFFLTEGAALVEEVKYIPLPKAAYELATKRFESGKTGSVFEGGSQVGVTVEELLQQ